MDFLTPSQKFRAALSSPTASLSHLDRISYKLQSSQPNVDYITSLRNTDPSTRQTSVHIAANVGRVDVVEWLIDEGHEDAEISRDIAGETVLHIAAARGHVEILGLYLSRYRFVVDWVNSRGMTPLHTVAMQGQLEAAQILLDHGADLNAPDLNGNSPLHYALSWGKLPVVKLLVELDCQTDSKNNQGFTAAEYAYSFAAADALKVYIRLHLDQRKAARSSRSRQARTARSTSRSSSTTPRNLRQARQTSSSALSISLPPNSPPLEEAPTPPLPPPLPHSTSPLPPLADSPAPSMTSFASGPVGLGVQVDGSPRLGPPLSAPVPIHPRSSSPSVAPLRPETPQSPVPSHPSFDNNTTSPARSARSVSNPAVDPSHPSPSTPTPSPRPSHAPSLSPLSIRRIGRTKSGNSPLSTPTHTIPHSPPSPDSASSTGTAAPVSFNATPTRQTPSSVESSPVPPSSPGPNKLRKKTRRSSNASAETHRPEAGAAAVAEGATILGGGRGLRGERSMSFGAAMASTGEVPGLPANLVGSPGRTRSSTNPSHGATLTDSATSSSAPGTGTGIGARPASRTSSSKVRPAGSRTHSHRSDTSDRLPSPSPPLGAAPVRSAAPAFFPNPAPRAPHDAAFVVLAGSSTRSSPMLPSSAAPPAPRTSPPLSPAQKLRKVSATRDRSESAGSKASAHTASTTGSASGQAQGGHGAGRWARALGLGRKGA
ncbi:hypothetical protein JCM21900_004690 [Sporobolomyces salmonicolor]